MKRFGKWLAKAIGTAITLVLIIVLLPYASKFMSAIMPDLTGAAVNTSVMLAQELKSSARLETIRVEEEGVLNSTTSALMLGEVQSVTVKYTYTASFGIDLTEVNIRTEGNGIVLELPALTVLEDDLHPDEIITSDFWYPLTEERRQYLLDTEEAKCREKYAAELIGSEDGWNRTVSALESTVSGWLEAAGSKISVTYVPRPQ